MSITILNKIIASFALLLMLATTHAAAASPDLLKAKQETEAKGYIFFSSHDEIVVMAKKEGKLRVSTGLDKEGFKPLINAFKQKYPFITDTHIEEMAGLDVHQRFLLEMQSGQAMGWDIAIIPPDFAQEYPPYLKKHDILGMAKQGVLKIDPRMVNPVERNILSTTSAISAVPYNRKLISEDKVPAKWEDFLKPEFKGKKFVLDIRPLQLAALVPAWGLERALDFARKLAAQQPVWGRGAHRVTAGIAAGEYSLYCGSNFAVVKRAMSKDPTGSLSYKISEPVPTRTIDQSSAILNTAPHPHAGLLWLEFLASPEGQEIIDKYEPFGASVYTPGSVVAQEVRGKELSVVDWNHATKFREYTKKIFAAYGFPKADKK
ncbi:MAG: substrate-binding domain-containing protein [Deltaproteobacteria bacterium]|nr:substrate-binding domain-containing protein [Deltaproteobacteria bacterium]